MPRSSSGGGTGSTAVRLTLLNALARAEATTGFASMVATEEALAVIARARQDN